MLSSKSKAIQLLNHASIDILFIIPIKIMIQGQMFEIYTTVYYIHDNVELLFDCQKFRSHQGRIEHKKIKT